MISIEEKMCSTSSGYELDSGRILEFITAEKSVTLELIVERFPWVRWGDVFSIVGGFRREGLVRLHQTGTVLEVQKCGPTSKKG